jgi:hypothetical protein
MDTKELNIKVGEYCKEFRTTILKLSLTEFAIINNENLKNIHAFEKGNANNIKYLFLYYQFGKENSTHFVEGLFKIL